MKVSDLLVKTARKYPENVAARHLKRYITYKELSARVDRLASRLHQLDVQPGGRVALLFENSIEYIVASFATYRAGLVLVPLDTSLDPEDIRKILSDCEPSILILQGRYRHHLARMIPDTLPLVAVVSDKKLTLDSNDIPCLLLSEVMDTSADETPATLPDTLDDDVEKHQLAAIFYTSGSTGVSKGVKLSHLNLVSNTVGTVEYLRLVAGESVLVILPFYYIYGNSLLLTHVACGGSLVIDNRFLYPETVLDTMEQEQVNGFSGVPSNFMILLNNSTFSRRSFPHLRYFTQAGGAMAPEIIRRLLDTFPDKELWIMYGQTEASPRITYLPPERIREKLGSIGIPVPGVKVDLVDEHGQVVGPGETGEIRASGENVMMGYFNQPDETAKVLRDGKLYTGDLARQDDEGYIYIVGRRREIIKSGGHRVSIKAIEERIIEHNKISEVAVFGIPDDILGEAIKAVIVLKPGAEADEREIRTFCQKNLSAHKVPKYFTFAGSLPKYQSGKVNKMALKEQKD